MSLNTRGFDGATMVPVGATVVRAYWSLPGTYTSGKEHPSEEAAIRAGIARYEAAEDKHKAYAGHGSNPLYMPLPESFAVDLRWKMEWPAGSLGPDGLPTGTVGTDTMVRRTSYANLTEAREHADRIAWSDTQIAAAHKAGAHRLGMPTLCPACHEAGTRG